MTLTDMGQRPKWLTRQTRNAVDPTDARQRKILDAVHRHCWPCPHVRRSRAPISVFAVLTLRTASCHRCVHTVRRGPPDALGTCDLCGERWGRLPLYEPLNTRVGNVTIAGAIGPCCAELPTRPEAA